MVPRRRGAIRVRALGVSSTSFLRELAVAEGGAAGVSALVAVPRLENPGKTRAFPPHPHALLISLPRPHIQALLLLTSTLPYSLCVLCDGLLCPSVRVS